MKYPDSCRTPPWPHQQEGTLALLQQPAFALLDDVGYGKSKQVVDAICAAFVPPWQWIDSVIIVAPGSVRSVWASTDPALGQLPVHMWDGVDYTIHEYSADNKHAKKLPAAGRTLDFVVTNYEYIRRWEDPRKRLDRDAVLRGAGFPHLAPLIAWARQRRTWLVLDESWAVSNPQADQTRACYLLRQACLRVTLLNGTPGKIEKLFAQFQILDENILGLKSFAQCREKYLVMGGYVLNKGTRFQRGAEVVGYRNKDEWDAKTRPYALRRDEGLGLPPVLPPLTLEARLSQNEWRAYRQMRDEMVATLDDGSQAVARQAGVKALRLSQILAGYVGGVVEDTADHVGCPLTTREIGKAKLTAVMDWATAHELHRLVLWCKFRAEMARFGEAFEKRGLLVHYLRGQQAPDDRAAALRAFAPRTTEARPAVLVGHPAAGGAGVNLASASVAVYTAPFGLKDLLQSRGRLNRPGQTKPVRFVFVQAVGPSGQRTVDHALFEACRNDEDIATWTSAHWRRALLEE